MCSRPQEKDGNTFACRSCNECIATRRNGWVARGMAEAVGWPHVLSVTLTYSDATQEGRDGARMFCYADVRAFVHRITAASRRINKAAKVRFLCAGEQGDRNGRCHWHMIIYSDLDLSTLGVVKGLRNREKVIFTDRSEMMTIGKRKKRLDWSLWPLGLVTFQDVDQGAMNYVLSYALKDQFTEEKSQDTMRHAKSENFATGLFRMSKRPAIGEDFLMRKLEALDRQGAVLPSLQIKVPGYSGYWHPTRSLREKLLWGLVALNQRVVWATGRNAPQWAALLASCKDNDKDMEILHGPEAEDIENATSFEAELDFRRREQAERERRKELVQRCSNALPCTDCLHDVADRDLEAAGIKRLWPDDGSEWQYVTFKAGYGAVETRQQIPAGKSHPWCKARGSRLSRLVFPNSDPYAAKGL